jgi:hypothetical protein
MIRRIAGKAGIILLNRAPNASFARADAINVADGIGYASPPERLPWLMKIMLWLAEKRLGKHLVANRILARYPKAF